MHRAARHRRAWLAVAAAVAAPALASRDHRTGWTVVVAVVTSGLAVVIVWVEYDATSAERAARRAAWERARAEEIVRRYELRRAGADPPRRLSKEERQRARVAAIVGRYERERASRGRNAERDP